MKEMNILYAIDEWKKDYSRYLWVSILSLLENNKNENVHIYIMSKYIEESNKDELIRIVNKYWKKISFSEWEIIPERFLEILYVWSKRPIAMYYRWFFNRCFDIKDRILYLDCDTIVNKNLSEFYDSDFKWNVIIWHLDVPLTAYPQKKKFWLKKYINSGVLLINIDLFKEEDLYEWVINVNKRFDKVNFPDQDYINIIYKDKIKIDDKLQLISCSFYYSNYSDYLIIHTVQKPNTWWLNYCPKKIEKLFNKYLEQTKWKTYLWNQKNISIKEYGSYIYDYCRDYCSFFFADVLWEKIWFFTRKFLGNIWTYIGKILKTIRLLK